MRGESVHGHRKSQQMTGHQEDQKQHLTTKEQLSTKATHEYLACICHARNMRESPFELSDHVAGIRGYQTQRYQNDNGGSET